MPSKCEQDILHPYGGGGRTMEPIGAAHHLDSSVPDHFFVSLPNANCARKNGTEAGAVSTAPYFYYDILPISYTYIKIIGSAGLHESTNKTIFNANYVPNELEGEDNVAFSCQRWLFLFRVHHLIDAVQRFLQHFRDRCC